ncbi:ABC transporter ATP-binding protein [Streptococcus iniae]|uniref:ABC transporter ATP-binding protein n=1 Tax=Streptococcus iniae TaxID=1346 RepID=A0A3L8GR06_STRIN|nr:ABC transporter ATP-binding protein [Streptococcus iniae]AGM98053.1 ABC transporter, ATP-binding protein [Streptococcus iniae SF1]AHY15124.1 hemin ABC transporter ATP-binding protein [Streptococcus iniae]AHY16994.1 hemin ABC transporter ATP-binding protein [Streptococcus iniae]AJG25311.1 hemin ABC transporter ATP-binding protein [Streptococcus iniae]APD31185.1 hemin ABC transporter ATP-binding protein [Streptococcus iniae]
MTILALSGVTKKFQDGEGERVVLDQLDLSVSKNEFVAILGPSGSGKSTLLSIAGLLLSADSGSIRIANQDLSALKQKQWTQKRQELLGFIFQDHQLLPFMTIGKQLQMVAKMKGIKDKKAADLEIDRLLEDLGISACKDKYPNKMSGGQKQRAAIARAFIGNPQVILADEPTASLDPERGRDIARLIQMEVKQKGKVAIMVTHDQSILDLVDTIYDLKNGKLIKR